MSGRACGWTPTPCRRASEHRTAPNPQTKLSEEISMDISETRPAWTTVATLIGRLVFAGIFAMPVSCKLMGMQATAGYIASAGFPMPLVLAWLAALLELALVACFLSGAYFSEAALVAAAYVIFLGFAFHGPS